MFIAFDTMNENAFGPFSTEEKARKWTRQLDLALEGSVRDDAARTWVITEVEHIEDEDHLDYEQWMGDPSFHRTFDPGALEDISLYEWDVPEIVVVVGSFRVYCGMGNEHIVAIDSGPIAKSDWLVYRQRFSGDVYLAVHEIVEDTLDLEWVDPCQESIEEGTVEDDEDRIEAETRFNESIEGQIVHSDDELDELKADS